MNPAAFLVELERLAQEAAGSRARLEELVRMLARLADELEPSLQRAGSGELRAAIPEGMFGVEGAGRVQRRDGDGHTTDDIDSTIDAGRGAWRAPID